MSDVRPLSRKIDGGDGLAGQRLQARPSLIAGRFTSRSGRRVGRPTLPGTQLGDEGEGQKARAEQHEANRGQGKKTVGDKVMMAHETSSLSDARPN